MTFKDNTQSKVHKAEKLICGFMSEHGKPFVQTGLMTELLKKMFPDPDVAQNMAMKNTKTSFVIQGSLAWEESEAIAAICRESKFSVMADQSTDISVS